MKAVFPVILTPSEPGYLVTVPDLELNTQGEDIANAIEMARDAIGLWGICQEDEGKEIPTPSTQLPPHQENEIVTFVDIDFSAYRRANDLRAVRKNVTIPSWLNELAEKANLNFSQVLQDGLKSKLHVENKY